MNGLSGLLKRTGNALSTEQIRHLAQNVSSREIFLRHPTRPCGVVFRDQGITDLYSQDSRVLLDPAAILLVSHLISTISLAMAIRVSEIENFTINGRHINRTVFDGAEVARILQEIDTLEIIGPSTVWDEQSKVFRNTVKLNTIIEPIKVIVEASPPPPTVDEEIHSFISSLVTGNTINIIGLVS